MLVNLTPADLPKEGLPEEAPDPVFSEEAKKAGRRLRLLD